MSESDLRTGEAGAARLRQRLLLGMGALMSLGALGWCALSLSFGFTGAAMIPLFYVALTVTNFGPYASTKRFDFAAFVQVLASVLLPFVFQIALGGLYASGASMLWALVAVVGSLTFSRLATTVRWLAAYLGLSVAAVLLDGWARAHAAASVSVAVQRAFLVGNLLLVSVVVLALILYFVHQRERAQHALARAREEIADLEREVEDARQLGQYTLVEKIGAGGMGTVYRARHAMLRRPTALKLVRAEKASETTLARFEREVQLTATLTHPHVVTVYDYGRTEDGTFYYAMEYLDGADLGHIVRRTGPMSPARTLHVLVQIASALAKAHECGLIHRDVKPANAILTNSWAPDIVKVVDFGLVKELSPGGVHESIEKAVSGTPAYMSPEAISKPHLVDGRTDVYSLGCLAYFLLTGAEPFAAESAFEVWMHHMDSPVVPPSIRAGSDLPRALEDIVLACLVKSAANRPTMSEVLTELHRLENEPWAAWDATRASEWWNANASLLRAAGDAESLDETVVARAPGRGVDAA